MRRAVDEAVGGRHASQVRWLGLGKLQQNARFAEFDGLEDLVALESLDLNGHALSSLEQVRGLRALQELFLARNRIRRLDGIGRLAALRVLDVSGNMIEHIPKQIGLLRELRWLDLSDNRLATVSELQHLASCPSLFRLALRKNPLSSVSNVREEVLRHCRALVSLDGVDVHVRGRGGGNLLRGVAEVGAGDSRAELEASVRASQDAQQKLEDENEELRAELQAVSQLLARKTSEWAVAEEQTSRLQQELAFLKIDAPPTAGSPERGQLASPRASPRAAQGLSRANQGRLVGAQDQMRELQAIDAEIDNNLERSNIKLKALAADYKAAKQACETLQAQLDYATAGLNRTRGELQAAEKATGIPVGSPVRRPVRGASDSDAFAREKDQELADLTMMVSKLRNLRGVLTTKMELAQDLLVLRTEALVARPACGAEAQDPSSRSRDLSKRQDALELDLNRISVSAVAAANDVCFSVSSSDRIRDMLPDLSLLQSLESSDLSAATVSLGVSEDEGLGSPAVAALFDASITKLSELVRRTKEEELTVTACLDGCLARIRHVEAALQTLRESKCATASEDVEVAPTLENAGESNDELRSELLRGTVRKEAGDISRLHDQLKASQVQLRETQIAILRLKSETWRAECALRSRQHAILSRLLDEKDSMVHACNRTISRLRDSGAHDAQRMLAATAASAGADAHQLLLDAPLDSPPSAQQQAWSGRPGSADAARRQQQASSMMQESEQKARACRRKVCDELVESEQAFVAALGGLMETYLAPMRRRCLLPPRDLQAVCGNLQELVERHRALLMGLTDRRDAQAMVGALERCLGDPRAYEEYLAGVPQAIAMARVRRHEVPMFASFLKAAASSSSAAQGSSASRGADWTELLLLPFQRLTEYERYLERLKSLYTAAANASTRERLGRIASTIRGVLECVPQGEKELLGRADTLRAITSVLPAHKSMERRQVTYLADMRQRCHNRRVLCQMQTEDMTLLRPSEKTATFRRSVCMVFTDFVVLAAFPTKWRATFEGELPKLRALVVIKARDELHASRPFTTHRVEDDEERKAVGIRLAWSPSGVRSPQPVEHDAKEDEEPQDDCQEAILRFDKYEQAEALFQGFEEQRREVLRRPRGPAKGSSRSQRTPGRTPAAGAGSPHARGGRRRSGSEGDLRIGTKGESGPPGADEDDLGYQPKYPGTDMLKRRELAKQLRESRRTWRPPELENIEASLAKERIRKRDGVPLSELHSGGDDTLALRDVSRPASPGKARVAHSASHLVVTPDRGAFSSTTASFASKMRSPRRDNDSLGFGSSSKLERNSVVRSRKARPTSPSPRPRQSPRGSAVAQQLAERAAEEECFDPNSPYYRGSPQRRREGMPDLGIFKAPAAKTPDTHGREAVARGYQSKRLIGIDVDSSEYLKEYNRQELRFYTNLEKRLQDGKPS